MRHKIILLLVALSCLELRSDATDRTFGAWPGTPGDLTLSTNVSSGGACAAAQPNCPVYIFANAHTLTRLVTNMSTAPVGCATNAAWGITDLTSATTLSLLTPTATGVLDSGALSIAMTAGHQFTIGLTTTPIGCATFGQAYLTVNYQ